MGFFDRFKRRWSLSHVERPWGGRPSLYSFLRAHRDPQTGRLDAKGQTLPDEDDSDGMRWAAGALDGVAGHHMDSDDDDDSKTSERADAITRAITKLAETGAAAELDALWKLVCEDQSLPVIDEVTDRLREQPGVEAEHVHAIGMLLASEAPDRETVKLGIALLGMISGSDDRELLGVLGAHDELTLAVAVATMNQDPEPELALWKLAQRVDGWGRIQTVERITEPKHQEVRDWLLRDGYRNSVMNEYLAFTCATAGGLHTALAAKEADAALLRGASEILTALANGGPAPGLADYVHSTDAIDAWLGHLERGSVNLAALEALDTLGAHDAVPAALRARIEKLAAAPAARAAIDDGLLAGDDADFGRADQAARRRGIPTYRALRTRLQKPGFDPTYPLFRIMEEATAETIDDALVAIAPLIDLASIATGPAAEEGFGPELVAHGRLDFVIQGLARFPGRGVEFLEAALRSPVVRNRAMALQTLTAWGRERWPATTVQALKAASVAEPDEELRAELLAALVTQ